MLQRIEVVEVGNTDPNRVEVEVVRSGAICIRVPYCLDVTPKDARRIAGLLLTAAAEVERTMDAVFGPGREPFPDETVGDLKNA